MTATRVMSCDAHGVELDHGRLEAGTIIWAAGVVASPAARWLDAEHDRAGRVKIGPDLSVPGHPEIFVVGDTAAVVKLGRLELTGFLGWLFWSVVHIYFLIGVRDRFIVAFSWLWDYITFQRGARLITEVPRAKRN